MKRHEKLIKGSVEGESTMISAYDYTVEISVRQDGAIDREGQELREGTKISLSPQQISLMICALEQARAVVLANCLSERLHYLPDEIARNLAGRLTRDLPFE